MDSLARRAGALGRTGACVDLRRATEDGEVRLSSVLDEETEAFEAELLKRSRTGSDGGEGTLELPVFQRHAWVRHSDGEFLLFQMRDAEGRAAMQVVLTIERPRRLQAFGRAIAYKLGPAATPVDEERGLSALRALCTECEDLVTLRLQPYRRTLRELLDFEAHARRAGYSLVDPIGVTRTLVYDVSAPIDAQLAALSKKTRAKVRHRERQNVSLRALTDVSYATRCTEAVNSSLARTGGGTTRYNFAAAFALAQQHPELVRVIGLFRNEHPDQLLAYVVGVRHGEMAEYSSAGSLSDPALRSMPFNYWLLWELITWANEGGARWLDLGGITDGAPTDARAGISGFKRHFSELDVELGREMVAQLRPLRALALDAVLDWRTRRAQPPTAKPEDTDG